MKVKMLMVLYEDDSADIAMNDAAEKIWDWWRSCETMNCIHGAQYTGPKFTHINPNGNPAA